MKVLVVASRGIHARHRHLVEDVRKLLPHSKRENKLDTKHDPAVLNEIAELKNCDVCLYFEQRKHVDLYLWLANTPSGPSVKFQVVNVHTMSELQMTGNHLLGSRPILSFDKEFDSNPQHKLLKELFTQIFTTPKFHRKSKPFIDHVFSFSIVEGQIWFRNFQIIENSTRKKAAEPELVEVGPRFVLVPIRIFSGSFGGETLYKNGSYISPNKIRAVARNAKLRKYTERKAAEKQTTERQQQAVIPEDQLESIFK